MPRASSARPHGFPSTATNVVGTLTGPHDLDDRNDEMVQPAREGTHPEVVQHLLDVVMLAHTLTRELAEVTGEHEYEILFRVQRDGMASDVST